jgi:hypothetical protein
MIGKFFKFVFIGILAIIGIGIGLSILGIALGLAVLAIKVGVVAAIGYGVYKMIGGGKPKPPEISAEDKKWLNS